MSASMTRTAATASFQPTLWTPGVALAYAVVAAGLLAVERFGSGSLSVAHPEPPFAVPAE